MDDRDTGAKPQTVGRPRKKDMPLKSYADVVRAVRAGQVVIERKPTGTHQSINPDRREKRAEMARLGLTSDRQWKRHKKRLRATATGRVKTGDKGRTA